MTCTTSRTPTLRVLLCLLRNEVLKALQGKSLAALFYWAGGNLFAGFVKYILSQKSPRSLAGQPIQGIHSNQKTYQQKAKPAAHVPDPV